MGLADMMRLVGLALVCIAVTHAVNVTLNSDDGECLPIGTGPCGLLKNRCCDNAKCHPLVKECIGKDEAAPLDTNQADTLGLVATHFELKEFYNGSKAGPGCDRAPLCKYAGAPGQCVASTDGTCTDIKVTCNATGIFYERFWATRDGSCKGPALGWFGGVA